MTLWPVSAIITDRLESLENLIHNTHDSHFHNDCLFFSTTKNNIDTECWEQRPNLCLWLWNLSLSFLYGEKKIENESNWVCSTASVAIQSVFFIDHKNILSQWWLLVCGVLCRASHKTNEGYIWLPCQHSAAIRQRLCGCWNKNSVSVSMSVSNCTQVLGVHILSSLLTTGSHGSGNSIV